MNASGIVLLREALDVLRDEALSSEELVQFAQLRPQVDSLFAAKVGAFDRGGAWALDGRKSMAGWLRSSCGMSTGEAHRHVRRATFASSCPLTASRWSQGTVSTEKIDRIASARGAVKADSEFEEFEPALVRVAVAGTVEDVSDMLAKWREALDASRDDPTKARNQDQIDREHLFVSETFAGMRVLSGEFTPIDGEEIETALDREMARLWSEGDKRSVSQRRCEALVAIMRAYNSGNINKGTNRPHISIHVDHQTWTGEAVATAATARGTTLSRETVMRMACTSMLTVITHDGNSIPLNMYRTGRTFNRNQRRALEYRDGGCRYPGCGRNATQTEAHHVDWWELGGDTNVENAALLCYHHHRLLHEGRWTIKIDGNAVIKWFRPDGSYYDTSYPRPPSTPLRLYE